MSSNPRAVLHRRHRLALWQRSLWIVVGALVIDVVLAYFAVAPIVRAWTFAVALVAALIVRFAFRPSLRDTARVLDTRGGTRNRLEALAAIEGRTDPLARAIEEETTAHLARRPLQRPYSWLGSLALLATLLALQLATLDLSATRALVPTGVAPASDVTAPAVPPAKNQPPPPTPMPRATLRWVEPQPGITATATENVPMLAESESEAVLTKLELRLTFAGEPAPPLRLPDNVAAGAQSISLALDLATLETRPFAFATYHLAAERARDKVSSTTPPWPEIFSPLQVIQIRPVGSDLSLTAPSDDDAAENETERLLFRVKRLKLAQVEVLKAVFALAHDAAPGADSSSSAGVQTFATQEREAWQIAATLTAECEKNIAASRALEPLRKAHEEIQKAWDELARADAAAAFAPADRGLARIADAERALSTVAEKLREEKAAADAAAAATEKKEEDQSVLSLPPREETPAGRLEALAHEQQALADQLAQGTAENAFARQDQIARALPKLVADAGFPPEVASAIKSAASDAAEAAKHLNDRDPRAATEPATRAAQTLQAIGAALDAAGRERAAGEFAAAQRELNGAALDTNDGAASRAAGEFTNTREELRKEAMEQQRNGSAGAAQQLADMSNAMDQSKVGPELKRQASQSSPATPAERTATAEKLTQLAQRAADARKQAQTDEERAKSLAQAAEELRRAQANAERAAQAGAEEMKDLYEKAQESAQQSGSSLSMPSSQGSAQQSGSSLSTPSAQEGGQSASGSSGQSGNESSSQAGQSASGSSGADRWMPDRQHGPNNGNYLNDPVNRERYARDLSAEIGRVVGQLVEEQRRIRRAQVLTTATPAEAPPVYRPAVGDYFESLARATSTTAPASAPASSAP